ncbi:MAG: TetR/AcrR family transcriptional regulator [Lachnospiraceae bacterium]|nr:TetR/AcrR family transcriptional regulator [Lachnospiraceae bacterium]
MKPKREALVGDYIEEALLLLMKTKDYGAVSITEICKKAGVTRMSFYRNFESKEDILKKWVGSITASFLADSRISYKNNSSREYFIKLFTHMEQHKDTCLSLYKAGLIYIVKEQFDRVFLEIHEDEYDEYKSFFLAGGIYNVFLLWLINGCRESPSEIADRMENIFKK